MKTTFFGSKRLAATTLAVLVVSATRAQQCDVALQETCAPCCGEPLASYNCSLPGLETFKPGSYAGVKVNYLSFVTQTSSKNFPIRAKEFEECTGGKIVFSEAANVWEDPVQDLGTKTTRGSEVYDGYFMSYSHFPEVAALDLAEHLNDRIREDNDRLKWEDVLPKVKVMGEYRKDGVTNIDFLMYDGDFFVPIIRLDLFEKHEIPLPNTWEEVVAAAKYFNGTDLNDDGNEDDYGFCHFPRLGAGDWDWWFSEAVYSTWATSDQTEGIQQGFFFDAETLEPRIGSPGFRRAADVWKDLWTHGSNCENTNFVDGRCAIGFGPPGCWKSVFLNGVSRKNANGTKIWEPTLKDGSYAVPYRFRPFGSLEVVDRATGKMTSCTRDLCPKAEKIPIKGHHGDDDRASILPPSPHEGKLINRAPFYWSGGLGTLIRKSAEEMKKDLMWDFFVYTNSPETSVHDVANYVSWLDSWRYSQLAPGKNFLQAGWSQESYQEHSNIMNYALSKDANGAFNLRLPGVVKYTRDVVGEGMQKFIAEEITLDDLQTEIANGWNEITRQQGKLDQLEIYRAALGLDNHSEVELCRLHRDLMDEKDPSVCRKYDDVDWKPALIPSIVVPCVIVIIAIGIFIHLDQKRRKSDCVWKIKYDELTFDEPPEILGRGTFGLVLLAEYRGTQVAVKRVIPPKTQGENEVARNCLLGEGDIEKQTNFSGRNTAEESGTYTKMIHADASGAFTKNTIEGNTSFASPKRRVRKVSFFDDKSLELSPSSDDCCMSIQSTSSSQNTNGFRFAFMYGDPYSKLKTDFIEEMRYLSKLRHPCITTVMGAVVEKSEEPMLVMEYMDHGSLYDILHNETFPLEGALILPILRDIARGLRFLHAASPTVIHGDLKAANVLVDSRFRAKVADFGLSAKKKVGATGTPLWMAPELLRGESNTTASDVYSFGIILYEVFSRKDPYHGEDVSQVLRDVANPRKKKRPRIPLACPPAVVPLYTDCIGEDPELRPGFDEIDMRIKRLDTQNVEPGDARLSFRKKKRMQAARSEELLYQVFPKNIADALRDGRQVEPEKKELATVFFSDIVGFTTISSVLTAEQVSDMLDRLYNVLDELTSKHDVFKIDTIGDAFMCATNLSKNQDSDHVLRMAEFAVDAIKAAEETLISTEDPSMGFIEIRAGFHCGPLIASVVGKRTPKYSVFGDTVNTASRMESNSHAGRVQCSGRAAELLRRQRGPDSHLKLTSRGTIRVKGKGEMETFFVDRE